MNATTDTPERQAAPHPETPRGLTQAEVRQRMEAGAHNRQPEGLTPSIGKIVRKNTCTLFNLINVLLALPSCSWDTLKTPCLSASPCAIPPWAFFQEVRAKRTLDKLSILAQTKAHAVRDGQLVSIACDEIVMDDVILLQTGNQVCADAVVLQSQGLEMDEALLTGEPDGIRKEPGDTVMSGSFVVGGSAYVRVTAVGDDNYATALTKEAKRVKKSRSKLMRNLTLIIRVLTFIIIPVGIVLFYNQYTTDGATIQSAVLGASAAMLGMIPEGLILLTGITLTVSALNLARNNALVQSLDSIETLARVDVICLDKTGTITDGTLSFETLDKLKQVPDGWAEQAVAELMARCGMKTSRLIFSARLSAAKAGGQRKQPCPSPPSASGAARPLPARAAFVIGAPAFVFQDTSLPLFARAQAYTARGLRVLCLAHSDQPIRGDALPAGLRCIALLVLSDTIRAEAPETFRYFREQGVALKVISGDDPLTVSAIAGAAGLEGHEKAVDMSRIEPGADLHALAEEYTVFGRVSPQQKRDLIRALGENGHTTCMTGDGVNDVPAMKEADCSVAMVGGSDAARSAAISCS